MDDLESDESDGNDGSDGVVLGVGGFVVEGRSWEDCVYFGDDDDDDDDDERDACGVD